MRQRAWHRVRTAVLPGDKLCPLGSERPGTWPSSAGWPSSVGAFVQRHHLGLPRKCGGRCWLRSQGAPCPAGTQEPASRPPLRRALSRRARTASAAGTGLGCQGAVCASPCTLGGARWPAARLHPHKSRAGAAAGAWVGVLPRLLPKQPCAWGHHASQQVGTPEPMQSCLQKVCSATPALMFGAGGRSGGAGRKAWGPGRGGKQAPPFSEVPGGPALALPSGFSQGSRAGEPVPEHPGPQWESHSGLGPVAETGHRVAICRDERQAGPGPCSSGMVCAPWLLPTSPTPKGL